ncbi:response regulator [Roseobacter weihaiensis]|uniref:response regulator n=1 Tax=Roseobacter weihaiensis TaxID=2763262 RepID=UPI001D0A376E|nr:response regulator [Roseobacter sp. H9]
MKTLAVDDDHSIRELLPMILAEAGIMDVTVAESADHALDLIAAQTEPFECFLLDIQMPGASGIELCAAVRQMPAYRKTPIIMLTAMTEKSYVDGAFVAGATDYITKPFDIFEVSVRIGMANRLAAEQRRVRELTSDAVVPNAVTDADPPAGFSDRLEIEGVKGLVIWPVFENYLGQLSRAGLQSSTFFAVHVLGGERIYSQSTPSEFEFAIRHVADAIAMSSMSGAVVMCYVGNGNFLCSSNAAALQSTASLEWDIQGVVDEKELCKDDGTPFDLEVAVGAALQPLLSQPVNLNALKEQALRRAMVRVREKMPYQEV